MLATIVLASFLMGQAQDAKSAPAPVTYQDVVKLLRTGQSEEEILDILQKSSIDVSFTLGEEQATELRNMRVSDRFIDALENLKKQPTTRVEDITDLVLILDCSGSGTDDKDAALAALQELAPERVVEAPAP